MRLVELVSKETSEDFTQIMLLRHSNDDMKKLKARGVSVEEYTSIQPTDSKYDYWAQDRPRIRVVVVIVDDCVSGVYRVRGVEREGNISSLSSNALQQFNKVRGRKDRRGRRFKMAQTPCAAINVKVTGWEGRQRIPVARSDKKLFFAIEVEIPERAPIRVEAHDFSDPDLERAFRDRRARFGNVATSISKAVSRQRRGQDVLRRLTLQNYTGRCAVCDVSDERLLRASHIVGWAEDEETRGYLDNVICLCSFHDALFENGYWSLDDQLQIVIRSDIGSDTIQELLPAGCSFREPSEHSPQLTFIRRHRAKHGLPRK